MCMYQSFTGFEKFNYVNPYYGTLVSYKIHSAGKAWATLVPVLFKVRIPDHWYKNWSSHALVTIDAYIWAASTKDSWTENQKGLRMSLKWRWTKCLQEVQWVLSCTILTLRVPDHCYIKILGCLFILDLSVPRAPATLWILLERNEKVKPIELLYLGLLNTLFIQGNPL